MNKPDLDIYTDLKFRLISAEFPEGQRMKPDALRKLYGCSASTIRENLFKLYCNHFLTFADQRGFRVPVKSEKMLKELAGLRILLEQQGARDSIAASSLTWESQLTAAHHKLAHIERQMESLKNLQDHILLWTEAEREFHKILVAGCPSDVLKEAHCDVFDRFRQMLVLNYGNQRFGFRAGNIIEHQNIVDAAIAGNADACCKAIEIHVRSGMSAMRSNFKSTENQEA